MNFFVEYYSSPFIPRKAEIDQTLQHNISLNFLKKIFILTNNHNIDECKKIVNDHNKVEIILTYRERQTFQDVFNFANTVTKEDDINITSNNDILLTESMSSMNLKPNDFYMLTRYEDPITRTPFDAHIGHSQDTWIWRGKNKITDADFYYGLPGCDNALVYIANQLYSISNPSYTYKTIHNHNSRIRTDSVLPSKRVGRPHMVLLPTYYA